MAVAFDLFSSLSAATTTSLSWAHTCSGSDRILFVWVGGWDGTGRSASVTYGGITMTQIADTGLSNTQDRCWLFRLTAPATGSNTIAVTITGGSMHLIAGAQSFTGASQTSFATPNTLVSSASSTTTGVRTVTSAVNDAVADGVIVGGNASAITPAAMIQSWFQALVAAGESGGGSYTIASASSVNCQEDWDVSAGWAHIAIWIKAVSVGIEQEGFLLRNDDGDEATATAKAAQDTGATIVADQVFRVRWLINASGDTPSKQYRPQARKVGTANWRNLKVVP
jgi:hypothetical protein